MDVRVTAAAGVALGFAIFFAGFVLFLPHGEPTTTPAPATVTGGADDAATPRAQLVAQVERAKRDGRAWVLLARLDFAADRYADAATEFAQALEVSKQVAGDPSVWCEYADALGMAQGGSLAGKPGELIMHALTLDPNNAKALEMAGSAAFEQNNPAAAAGYWRQLLAQLPPRSQERQELAIAVARAEELAASGPHLKADNP
jgi:cytochrome c-type biogenesis protein CcmH